ncbi:hypothetical protein PO124_27600 [Bacillus licheniformis]|nr:hypothetical protein [Bacillus licheniformis]
MGKFICRGRTGRFRIDHIKGRTLIEAADVILYDRLVNSRLLEHAKHHANLSTAASSRTAII